MARGGVLIRGGPLMQALAPGRWRPSVRHCILARGDGRLDEYKLWISNSYRLAKACDVYTDVFIESVYFRHVILCSWRITRVIYGFTSFHV